LLLCLGLASCATGADSGSPPPDVDSSVTEGDASTDASGDGSAAQDTGPGLHDTGATIDTGLSDSGTAGDTGAAGDAPSDVVANDAPVSDSGCPGHGTTGALVTYVLTSEPGSETSVPATTAVTGVTGGALTRSSVLTASSGAGSINSSGWGTGATFDATKYYTFEVTPAAGCSVSLTKLALDVTASSTGPTKGDVATSADAFGTHSASFTGTSTPAVTLSASGSGAIEVRVYGYGASGSGGTFRIQNTVTLSGTIN
jgi:hypothetical protein